MSKRKTRENFDPASLVKPLEWFDGRLGYNYVSEASVGIFLFKVQHEHVYDDSLPEDDEYHEGDEYWVDTFVKNESIYLPELEDQTFFNDLDGAKQAAQDWLIDLVREVCGYEDTSKGGTK